jgi:hypothetical protein
MIQKEVILIILIAIVIYLIINNKQVRPNQFIKKEFMTNDFINDMYLMDNASLYNNQADNSFMYNKSNQESDKINNFMYEQISDDNMPNSEEKLYGAFNDQVLQNGIKMQNKENNMQNKENNMQNKENNMQNDVEKTFGTLYGQALQNSMDFKGNMNMFTPMPIDMSSEFDKPMDLKMDFPIDFNKPMDLKMDMSHCGENMIKENMWGFLTRQNISDCPMDKDPVICPNGKTYDNMCNATNSGQVGCKLVNEISYINDDNLYEKYKYLVGSNINNIRSELDKIESSGINVRILYPGASVTSDYDMNRVNISVGDDYIVKNISMG